VTRRTGGGGIFLKCTAPNANRFSGQCSALKKESVSVVVGQASSANGYGVLAVEHLPDLALSRSAKDAHWIIVRTGPGVMNEFFPPFPGERPKAHSQDLALLGYQFHGAWLPSWFIRRAVHPP